jgi:hypothetical protein
VHGVAMFLNTNELETDNDVRMMMQVYPEYLFEISRITLVFGLVVLLIACLEVYFYSVVLRAYGYLQKVKRYPPPLTVGWNHRV